MDAAIIAVLPLLTGWVLDLVFGDPERLPHPVVWFGRAIAACERCFNRGANRRLKGALCVTVLVGGVFAAAWGLLSLFDGLVWLKAAIEAVMIFYCMAGTTLIREVREVFHAVERSLEAGRERVGRIVGRDTSELSAREIRTAALETLAENLSDGVVAPLFWYAVLGVPGMLAYKMVNTLDSMIGYRNERYRLFGMAAARLDDAANFIPARLTAWLMVILSGRWSLFGFVRRYARKHLSPNSGYPESALAGVLRCRFGGPHSYFGEIVDKPFIGSDDREIVFADMLAAVVLNRRVEAAAVLFAAVARGVMAAA